MDCCMLKSYISALRPILHIQSKEYSEVCAKIRSETCGMFYRVFMQGMGVIDATSQRVVSECDLQHFLETVRDEGYEQPTAIILLGASEEDLAHPVITAQLLYIADRTLHCAGFQTTVFWVSDNGLAPNQLEHLITLLPYDRPQQVDIEYFLHSYAQQMDFQISEDDVGRLALELKGLSFFQIKSILDLAYVDGGLVTWEDRQLIIQEKKQIVQKSGLLEYVEWQSDLDNVGGLGHLKLWLGKKAKIMQRLDAALKAGVSIPKGILIVGFPGCGKSLVAKTTATQFGLPLLRLDVGKILGKYVGQSERNMRFALAQAEAVSPCVLWVDEVEKAFAGGDGSGHEVTSRLIGQFLTWMQEKQTTVFVVATANDLERLPTEFLRKGRFDEVFSVGLPNKQERYQILKIHLRRRNQYDPTMNMAKLLDLTENFSGADIEAGVGQAVENCFLEDSKKIVSEADLIAAMKDITPLSKALQNKFSKMKEKLGEYNVKPASDA